MCTPEENIFFCNLKTSVIMDIVSIILFVVGYFIIGYFIIGLFFVNELTHLIAYRFKIFSKEDYEIVISNYKEKEISDGGRRIIYIYENPIRVISICKDTAFLCPYSVYIGEKTCLIWRFSPEYKKVKKEFEDNRKLKSKS